jgi:polysaccharide export outer membrane protein
MWGLSLLMAGCPNNATTGSAQASGRLSTPVRAPAADTLDVGDQLEVRIFGEPELTGPHKVRSDGTIMLPLAGRVEIRGMTPEQAAEAITAAYATGYLKNPQVTVVVTALNSKRFYVLGAVNSPGVFAYEQDMDVLRAVIMAGGFGVGASRNSVLVTRKLSGTEVRMEVPVDDIGQGKARNVPIMPGDIVFVPTTLL